MTSFIIGIIIGIIIGALYKAQPDDYSLDTSGQCTCNPKPGSVYYSYELGDVGMKCPKCHKSTDDEWDQIIK